MDFITDLPYSIKSGTKTFLIIINQLNERVILILILSISAPAVVITFIKHYIP